LLVQCDASQLEWRTILELSGDPVGIAEVNEADATGDKTKDTHSRNQKELVLPSRLIAKIFLFRTIFRGSGWAFANDPDFMHVSTDPKFWDQKNAAFYAKYRGIDACHKRWAQTIMSGNYIEGFTGRQWFAQHKLHDGIAKIPWTTLTNYPVQGTGADLVCIARISLHRRIKSMGLRSILVSTVHDSIVADCPQDEVDTMARLMHQVFADLPANVKKLFGRELSVKFPCEVKVGKNMLEMTEYHLT